MRLRIIPEYPLCHITKDAMQMVLRMVFSKTDPPGKPVSMDTCKYVLAILSSEEVTTQFEEVFGDSGYRIKAVTIEKVLVGGFRDVPFYQGKMVSGKVPFDAVVWFRLEKR